MTVQFDDASATWRVIGCGGTILADGFTTNAAAWAFADAHSDVDQADAVRRDRISNAMRQR